MIPEYISNKDKELQQKWLTLDLALGRSSANQWLESHIQSVNLIAQTKETECLERLVFIPVVNDQELIVQTDGDEEYVDFVLADSLVPSNDGKEWDSSLLQRWIADINNGLQVKGDIDHEEYDRFLKSGLPVEQVAEMIKHAKKGIAKTVKAFFDKGKMYVRAIIDKRYRKIIEKANGVSLEALATKNKATGKYDQGNLLGFTFAIKHQRQHPNAVIL